MSTETEAQRLANQFADNLFHKPVGAIKAMTLEIWLDGYHERDGDIKKLIAVLEFCKTAIDHAVDLEYVGKGSTLQLFTDASNMAEAALKDHLEERREL